MSYTATTSLFQIKLFYPGHGTDTTRVHPKRYGRGMQIEVELGIVLKSSTMFLPLSPMPWPSYFRLHLSVFSSYHLSQEHYVVSLDLYLITNYSLLRLVPLFQSSVVPVFLKSGLIHSVL